MNSTSLAIFLLLAGNALAGNGNDAYIISQRGFVQTQPVLQFWSIDREREFSELSNQVFAYLPLSRSLSVTLRNSQAVVSGEDSLGTLAGVTDTQLGFSLLAKQLNVVFTLGINLPSGRRQLTSGELATSVRIANDVFALQVPNFGQGLNLSPGLTWASPVSESVVVGLGISYQIRGEYEPRNLDNKYDPGDELLLTTGIGLRLSETSSLAVDVIFTRSTADGFNGKKAFKAGNRFLAIMNLEKEFRSNILRLRASYRSRGKNEFVASGLKEKTLGNRFSVETSYLIQFTRRVSLNLLLEGRLYEKTIAQFSGVSLVGMGIAPTLTLGRSVRLPLQFKFQAGRNKDDSALYGFLFGAGLSVEY